MPALRAEVLVRGQREELDVCLTGCDLLEQHTGFLVILAEPSQLLVRDSTNVVFGEFVVMKPMPDLRSSDLRSRIILHEIEDRNCTCAVKPRAEVLDPDRDVVPQAVFRDLAGRGRNVEELGGVDR